MARFIVVHRLPASATQDEVIAAGRAMAAPYGEARWLRGWLVPGEARFLCEWEAQEEGTVRRALESAGLFPVEAVYPATTVCPAWFTGR